MSGYNPTDPTLKWCASCKRWRDCLKQDQECHVCGFPHDYKDTIKFRNTRKLAMSYECNLKKKYNLSLEDYAWMCHKQDFLCVLCLKKPTTFQGLVVDHDHATGRVRGLLCNPCNVALGFVEKPGWRERLNTYL